jgi:hypothetical protein
MIHSPIQIRERTGLDVKSLQSLQFLDSIAGFSWFADFLSLNILKCFYLFLCYVLYDPHSLDQSQAIQKAHMAPFLPSRSGLDSATLEMCVYILISVTESCFGWLAWKSHRPDGAISPITPRPNRGQSRVVHLYSNLSHRILLWMARQEKPSSWWRHFSHHDAAESRLGYHMSFPFDTHLSQFPRTSLIVYSNGNSIDHCDQLRPLITTADFSDFSAYSHYFLNAASFFEHIRVQFPCDVSERTDDRPRSTCLTTLPTAPRSIPEFNLFSLDAKIKFRAISRPVVLGEINQ